MNSCFPKRWVGCFITLAFCVSRGISWGQSLERPKHNLLFIGQAKGYRHEAISSAMVTLFNLGRNSGVWNTELRTDCTAITKKPLKYEAKNLDAFDAIVFFTDGDLDMDDSQRADLLSFVRDDGKGFIGIHSAAITFTTWREYGEMLGGYFDGHPWGQFNAPLVVEDSMFPGMENFSRRFTLFDEIYQIKAFTRNNCRVLLSLDPEKLDLTRKGVRRTENGFPVIWAKNYGKGRVLYNGLGHVQSLWDRADFQKMWFEMVEWSMKLVPGDATPRATVDK
jgi:type 1 glutamine amidotransferase